MFSSLEQLETTLLKKDIEIKIKENELLKAVAIATVDLLQKENELIKVKANIEILKLKTQLEETNWELLKTYYEKLYLREFIISFCEKYNIRHQMGTIKWTDKWRNFLRDKEESLNLWYFDEKLFIEKYSELYENFNKNAHPAFIIRDCIEIPVNMFTRTELRVLGFIWENWPLPLSNFKIRHPQKPPTSIATLKKEKNEFQLVS